MPENASKFVCPNYRITTTRMEHAFTHTDMITGKGIRLMSIQPKMATSPELDTGKSSVSEMEMTACQDELLLASRIARITHSVSHVGFFVLISILHALLIPFSVLLGCLARLEQTSTELFACLKWRQEQGMTWK